ncbi:OmpH family outer membrane protein [Paracoccus tegillarcae]|uniref:Molecular chaperone Skp n=1 Tax=Paracoccus tegillarcae TaxID=1529068 RepID=A0A2K9EMN9_9RHOB|nr:OmpH family outer membrane protein [Paracoccus tegillarcae]AUH34707.1 molecular chaperone Skp [Paracoccus tegillarcae]
MLGRGLSLCCLALLCAGPVHAQEAPPLPGIEPQASRPESRRDGNPPLQIIEDNQQQAPVVPVVSPVLTVDQEQLFAGSAWGRRIQADLDAAGIRLDEENDRLYKQLVAEEAELTELRKTLDAAEFRERAEAFDARATRIRREFAQSVEDLNADLQREQAAFFQAAGPIMGLLMQERGALAVLDRQTTLVSVGSINITSELIARIDAELGDGSDRAPDAPPADTAGTAQDDAASETGPEQGQDANVEPAPDSTDN